jgi:PLP dependent protein
MWRNFFRIAMNTGAAELNFQTTVNKFPTAEWFREAPHSSAVICPVRYGIEALSMVDVAANYRAIQSRINEAAERSRRKPEEIKLLAAAKSQSIEAIRAAIATGVTLVGENYVQEALDKRRAISETVEWHMIGHLQRNKARVAVELFSVVESLDNFELARELAKEGRKKNKQVRAFVEVNLGGEESKSGLPKNKVADLLKTASELSNIRIEGLMAVPPFKENPEEVRSYFRELRELKLKLREERFPNVDLKELSMGMTHDFTIAIEEGATIVRIGTALFGPRNT